MTTESNPTKFKVLIGILVALLIALGLYTYSLYNENTENKDTVSTLEVEKENLENELEELIANYDQVIKDNELKDQDLLAAKGRIEELLADLKKSKANAGLISRYKAEIDNLKAERLVMFKKADSLIASNQVLLQQRDSTTTLLGKTIQRVDSVTTSNVELAQTIAKGSQLSAVDLRGEGVILRSGGRIVDTKRASRADKIRACFTLTPNPIAASGDKTLYVQVINPANNVLGVKETLNFENASLTYSSTVTVFYENDELDVCSLVNANEEDLVKGTYTINVFDGARMISTSLLDLK